DSFHFQATNRLTSADPAYDWRFDRDADLDVDALDLFHFARNYFTVLPPPGSGSGGEEPLIGGGEEPPIPDSDDGAGNEKLLRGFDAAELSTVPSVPSVRPAARVRESAGPRLEAVKPAAVVRGVEDFSAVVRGARERLPFAGSQGPAP